MFKFKGISSEEMKVVVEEEDELIAKASQRYEVIDIEGRNGSLYNSLGYSDIEIPLKLYVLDISKLDEILAWLDGVGELEYKNRITTAIFFTNISPIRSSSIKIIDCTFIRGPFWLKKDDFITVNDNICNYGNVVSKPIIRLEKNTAELLDVTINNIRFIYTFDEDNVVEIDCETMNATCNGILKNRNLEIDFEFPSLNPGDNKVIIHSGDSTIKVKRKDCWL